MTQHMIPLNFTSKNIAGLAFFFIGFFTSPAFPASSILVSWDASPEPDLMGYNVYMGTSQGSYHTTKNTGPNPSYVFQNLPQGITYYFTVTAYDQTNNESLPSEEVSVKIPDITMPTTPGNLTLNSTSNTQVSFSWTASTDNVGVTGYDVARNNVVIGQSSTNAYVDKATSPGMTYYYTVKARDANGNVSAWSAPLQFTPSQVLAQLNVSVSGNGTIVSTPNNINCPKQSCSASYPNQTVVTLTPISGNGWTFSGWSGSCTGTAACSVTLSGNRTVNANFTKDTQARSVKDSRNAGRHRRTR
ncbi:fibronectin type III domain-containing protein [uncultured Nitrospira sp.]|uniref:fibronectin type III domain-containing protein n=1 Tax=uncultured Nitrospira sp. TaxID=157176 RepID=UPI003140661D